MKFLIIGLGSMGKRRIRNLQALQAGEIIGFDPRSDRRSEAEAKYGIKTTANLDQFDFSSLAAMIISTPPDIHNRYIKLAIEKGKPAFIEASVVLGELEGLAKLANEKNILLAPSCTLRFHPVIKDIAEIVKSKKYGKVTTFNYQSGQFLPDWHPWENVQDFYVSKKETGGAREIVPFELTWIVDVLGFPKRIKSYYGKTTDVGADIDDVYALTIDFDEGLGTMIVDVVSRYGTRSLILNMERGQLVWHWDENTLKLYEAVNQRWIYFNYPLGQTVTGYNKNIIEEMYVEEMKTFISAVKGEGTFPNSLAEDIKVLKLLEEAEKNNA